MGQGLVQVESPEEREYRRYLQDVEVRRRKVADAQAELESLRTELGRFVAEYHARVGVLFVERDRLALSIEEYEVRIARLHSSPQADLEEIERDVRDTFRKERQHVRDEEQESEQYQQEHRRQEERPRLAGAEEAELKRMYRDLAKRFHPDLAKSDEERRQRETVMQQVNAAFADRSLDALRNLLGRAEIDDPDFARRSVGDKLVWAIREVARLDALLETLAGEVREIRESDTFDLWTREKAGERVLEQLEDDLKREIRPVQEQLAALISTYRMHLENRQP